MRKLMFRRSAAPLLLAALLTALVGALASAKTTIYHYHSTSQGAAWLQWLQHEAPIFEKQNPDIEIKLVTGASTAGELSTLIAAGTEVDVSELVLRDGAAVANQGGFQDLRPFLSTSSALSLDKVVPIAKRVVTLESGEIWGIPLDLYIVPTHFNADMFRDAGLQTPAEIGDGWNFDAALTDSKRLTVDTNGDGKIDRWGTQNPYSLWIHSVFINMGARVFAKQINPTQPTMNTTAVVNALRWVAGLNLEHHVADMNSGAYGDDFPKGIYGWTMGAGPNESQTLSADRASFRWGVALPIGGAGGRGAYTGVNTFQIPVTAKHPQEAWKWIQFLLTQEQSWESYIALTGRLPAWKSYMPVWLKSVEALPNPPEHAENYVNTALRADNYPELLSPYAVTYINTSRPMIKQVIAGTADPVVVLNQLQAKMEALFGQSQ
ncbi:MAG TPA: extracellular solute-binding protein [Limnochordia bacterium]|nr:extracellular solute-binding protein [Limnochordia bacterium]